MNTKSYGKAGLPALSCDETYAFSGERYADLLRQAEIHYRSDEPDRVPASPVVPLHIFNPLLAFGRALAARLVG